MISYSLEYDAGTNQNQWTALTGVTTDFTELAYVVTEGILRGGTYNFRLRAKNDWGWGVYSDVVAIIAATRPLAVDDITSSVESNGNFLGSWSPADDQGSDVTQYTIQIWRQVTNDWGAEIVQSETQISISMSDLETTYGYVQGDMILVRVKSENQFGESPYSTGMAT